MNGKARPNQIVAGLAGLTGLIGHRSTAAEEANHGRKLQRPAQSKTYFGAATGRKSWLG